MGMSKWNTKTSNVKESTVTLRFSEKFGLYSVDFEDDNRTRTAKASAHYFKQVVASKCLLETGNCVTN